MTTSTEPQNPERSDSLHRHAKRKEWGLAILAWDRDGRRAYQFEDGALRLIAKGFESLMLPADRPVAETREIVDRLNVQLARNDATAAKIRKQRAPSPALFRLEDQVAYFRTQYTEGFSDPAWTKDVRGDVTRRRIKRHRDPAIAQARELLGAERLAQLLGKLQFSTIHADVVAVLEGTDLVTPAQVKALARLDAPHHQALSLAVRDLLHGAGAADKRLGRFVDSLTTLMRTPPSWQLATVLPALFHSKDQLCVRTSVARDQARSMAPHLDVENVPSASAYERLLAMAKTVSTELEQQGLAPRDLMDVHDFMRLTLSSKARREMEGPKAAPEKRDVSANAA